MLEEYGGWAVVAGVLAEVLYAFVYRGDKPFWEAWTPVFASALIAFGVIVEILSSRKAAEASDELDRRSEERVADANLRAAEANQRAALLAREVESLAFDAEEARGQVAKAIERAANAERETERLKALTAWRRLEVSTAKALGDALAKIPIASVQFAYILGDNESRNFADELAIVFRHHGWNVGFAANTFITETRFGIWVAANVQPEAQGLSIRVAEALSTPVLEAIEPIWMPPLRGPSLPIRCLHQS